MGSSTSRFVPRQHHLPSISELNPFATPRIGTPSRALLSEILLIAFNLAHETTTLSALRVVSRQFNHLLLFIVYRNVTLNPRVFACFQRSDPERSEVQLNIVKDICRHTRLVTIDTVLHWPSVLQLLHVLEDLRELTYIKLSDIADSVF